MTDYSSISSSAYDGRECIPEYSLKIRSADIPLRDYIVSCRDVPRFFGLCKECPGFGRTWGCPPFEHDTDAILNKYDTIRIFAAKVTPAGNGLSLQEGNAILFYVRRQLEPKLLELEKISGGRAFSGTGSCRLCPAGTCTRPSGRPCRHPVKMRPSLEAYGFNIGKTAEDYFGLKLLWGKDGKAPDYYLLVTAIMLPHGTDASILPDITP